MMLPRVMPSAARMGRFAFSRTFSISRAALKDPEAVTVNDVLAAGCSHVKDTGFTLQSVIQGAEDMIPPDGLPDAALKQLLAVPEDASPKEGASTREEMIAEAKGFADDSDGPALFLLMHWLQAQEAATEKLIIRKRAENPSLRQLDLLKYGMQQRLLKNVPVLPFLADGLTLLAYEAMSRQEEFAARLGSSFQAPLLTFLGYMTHTQQTARSLASTAGLDSQGTEWYGDRAVLATAYAAGEISSLSPSAQGSAEERVQAGIEATFKVLDLTDDVKSYTEFAERTWGGIFNSLGLKK